MKEADYQAKASKLCCPRRECDRAPVRSSVSRQEDCRAHYPCKELETAVRASLPFPCSDCDTPDPKSRPGFWSSCTKEEAERQGGESYRVNVMVTDKKTGEEREREQTRYRVCYEWWCEKCRTTWTTKQARKMMTGPDPSEYGVVHPIPSHGPMSTFAEQSIPRGD